MPLQTRVCSVFPTTTVAVDGELDMESGPWLRDYLTCMIWAHDSRLALDLSGVTFIDCAGLSPLLTARKAAQAQGGWLHVIAVSRCVGRLIDITALQNTLFLPPPPRRPADPPRSARPAQVTRAPHHEQQAGTDAI
jgi:anti-anti-sigma factor